LGALWREFEISLVSTTPAANDGEDGIQRLTRGGYVVTGPRFDGASTVVYSARNADSFPALNRVSVDGSTPARITTRYFGVTTAIGRDALYFDQLEIRRNVGIYSDLYAWSRAGGRVTRLTSEARLLDPDVSPDGATIVCVQEKPGQRDLVLVHLPPPPPGASPVPTDEDTTNASVTTLVSESETQFNAPRWSPDGRTIAVERHQRGSLSEIVLVDATTTAVRVVAADEHARFVTPTWRP